MIDLPPDLIEFRRLAGNLVDLLDDPHLGLMTWSEAVMDQIDDIAELAGYVKDGESVLLDVVREVLGWGGSGTGILGLVQEKLQAALDKIGDES